MNDTLRELAFLALRYHKAASPHGEGEYGCPGVTCPGVQRLMGFARDVALAAVRADHVAHSFKDSRDLVGPAPIETPEDATKALAELQVASGESCTCLSISRDPLCVHHGDVDKVASLTPKRTLRAALETHLRWLRFHVTEPHVAANEPARTSYQHAADMLQSLLTEQHPVGPTEATTDQAKAMVSNYVHLKSLNVTDAEQMLEANISEALAASQDALELVQLIEARAADAALRGQGSPTSQRDDALAELAETRRFWQTARARVVELEALLADVPPEA